MDALIITHYKFHSGLHLLSVPDIVHNEAGLPAPWEDGDHGHGLGVALHGLTALHRERGLITDLRENVSDETLFIKLSTYLQSLTGH